MIDRTQEDINQDKRIAVLARKVDELHTAVDALGASLDKLSSDLGSSTIAIHKALDPLTPIADAIRRIEGFLGEPR